MAMPPQERSKTLHNFSLPCLKWGSQRHLKCVKDPPPDDHHLLLLPSPPPPPPPPPHHRPSFSSAVLNGSIQARPAIGNPVQHNNATSSPDLRINGGADDPPSSSRPWNLRTRRAACKAPLTRPEDIKISNQKSPKRAFEIDSSSSPPAKRQCLDPPPLPPAIRGKPSKLRVPLSKEEIEEDFMEIARIRPPRRPKKRPRIVQKYLDVVFPGLWLTEVTADLYKVPEVPES
ncbi:unnamed protein product [Linum trigynum]|uniref:DUF1639 family protein n=1 Tax=Linum trigynum TaxID=586398 RepID=A0AAV2DAG6_9ROSI